MTTNTHPYAEILRAIADGHQVQWQDPTGRWRDQTACTTLHEISSESYGPDRYRIKPRTITINGHEVREPLRAMPPDGTEVFWPSFVSDDLVEQEPVQTRERFESWVKAYSTLPLAKDSHGYADMAVEMLWHAWQAAKTNAPEGASEGESDANTRLGLAGHDSNCKHEFSVQPSSGIRLCAHCSLSEVATRKHTAPQPARQPLTDEQINDIARYKCYLEFEDDGEAIEIFARAIERAHGIGGEA